MEKKVGFLFREDLKAARDDETGRFFCELDLEKEDSIVESLSFGDGFLGYDIKSIIGLFY